MKRRGSIHINRCDQPGFDFLIARKLSGTPQPTEIKQKKMFLSLYRTLKPQLDIPTPKIQKIRHESNTRYYPESLTIESLIPVRIKTRVSTKTSSVQIDRTPKNDYCSRIKVNIQTRKTTPFSNSYLEDMISWG